MEWKTDNMIFNDEIKKSLMLDVSDESTDLKASMFKTRDNGLFVSIRIRNTDTGLISNYLIANIIKRMNSYNYSFRYVSVSGKYAEFVFNKS